MTDQTGPLGAPLSDGERERLARRILRDPRAKPDDIRAARYALCVLERKRQHAHGRAGDELPPLR